MAYLKRLPVFITTGVAVLAVLLFSGCGLNSESNLKETIEQALEDKYGEEFICHDIRANGGSSYFGVCSPNNHQEIKFTTLFLAGGTITYDGYYSSCVMEKIEEMVAVQLEDVFVDYYIHSYMPLPLVSRDVNDICAENVRNKSFDIDTYINLAKGEDNDEVPVICFVLCVNTSESGRLSAEEEYDALYDIFAEVDSLGVTSSVVLKFVPEEIYADCMEYLENSDSVSDTFNNIVEEYPIDNPNMPSEFFFSLAENKGNLTLTKEEYVNQR